MSGSITIFYGAVVTPISLKHWKALPNCLVVVGPTGNIEWMIDDVEHHRLEEMLSPKGYLTSEVIVLEEGEFLIPGFIDTHTHAVQFPNLGKGGQYELLEWLLKVVFPKEEQFEDRHFAKEVFHEVIRRSLDFGTTTSCYYSSLHLDASKILADVANKLGQRAFIGKCNMDRENDKYSSYVEESTECSIRDTRHLISHIRSLVPVSKHASIGTMPEPLVQPILTPRFALACTSDCMNKLGHLADEHERVHPLEPPMRIQTHIAENPKEYEDVINLYPKADGSYAKVYEMHGVLRETTVLGHAVHLTKKDIYWIKKKNAGISHCPTSNFYLTSGIAPIGKYLDEGLKVGLGTDVGGGYAISMLNVIQNASIASKMLYRQHLDRKHHPQPADTSASELTDNHHHTHCFTDCRLEVPTLFYLATLGGADVCNLSKRTGSLAEGKSFDALLVSVLDDTGALGVWGKEAKSHGHSHTKKREKLEENLERFLFLW
ncbi:hypothetical protein D9756_009459 [Leucocoprinus leucothites]|uniref:Amidohydrolase-related domain-containing protein n=1 Tax=Leucocoprinus leucothites TaxID=201217 RepID=A0A8H5FUE8_9AGAR|nr:hypothetical protein D9756_009459 [Leucoagaricus leucothites]